MRFGTRQDGVPCLIDSKDQVLAFNGKQAPHYDSLLSFIEAGEKARLELKSALMKADENRPVWTSIDWTAPIPNPRRNIMCVGKNYRAHAEEFSKSGFDSAQGDAPAVPDHPVVFSKAPESVIGPGDEIVAPSSLTQQVDYEAEIAVIISKEGRFISRENAMDHVFGYALLNDVTARDLQKDHKQWFLGKSIDTFCPMGPIIVSKDDVNIDAIRLQCRINGMLRQNAVGEDLIFDVPTIIETLSKSMTLKPGDIIATGTPEGVGIGMSPPTFLKDGDEIEVSAVGLGSLRNVLRVA